MASLTPWTWVWTKSWRDWRTGKPCVLQFVGSQRVRHDLATKQPQWKRFRRSSVASGISPRGPSRNEVKLRAFLLLNWPLWFTFRTLAMCPLSTHGWHCSFQLQSIQALCFSPPSSKVSTPHLQEPHSESHHREGSAVPLHSCEDTDIQNPSHTHTHTFTYTWIFHTCLHMCTHTHTHAQSHISQPCSVLRVCWAPWRWALSGPDHPQGWCVHTPYFSLHLWPSRIAPLQTLSSKEAIQASVSEASSGEHAAWDSPICSARHLEPGPRLLHWGFCKSAGTQRSQNLTHWPGFCLSAALCRRPSPRLPASAAELAALLSSHPLPLLAQSPAKVLWPEAGEV